MKKWILLLSLTALFAQSGETTLSPVVTYWKTLSAEEREIFLFSYLTQVYETHNELKQSEGYGDVTEWYYTHRAELVYGIFDKMDVITTGDMIKWIDEFYSHGEYANRPFYEALEFAYRFSEASGATLWEKYENLKFDSIKPDKD